MPIGTGRLRRLPASVRQALYILAACFAIGASTAFAAVPSTPSKLETGTLATLCTPAAAQAVVATVKGMAIAPISNGPKLDSGLKYAPAAGKRPAYCQITGTFLTNPKTGKTANFLATFPESWNRKYLQFGCFGHCGFFSLNDATTPLVTIVAQGYPGQILEKGYASFGTDQGHDSMTAGKWAAKGDDGVNDDAIEDYLYRANKALAQAGKALTRAFYSKAARQRQKIDYAYFCGCSGGGRDALVAAAYFPEEFDGIVSGSPYANMANVGVQVIGNYVATLRSAGADVPPALIAQIDPIVKAQCDALDGVKDGLIQNPAACNFRAERDLPRCANDQPGANCFTLAQVQTISTVLTAVTDQHGAVIQPGFSVSEILPFFREGARPADLNAAVPWQDNGTPGAGLSPLGDAVYKMFTHKNDPAFNTRSIIGFGSGGAGPVTDYRVVVPRAEVEKAYAAVRMGIGSDPKNAARLIKAGHKLLIWHNGSDEKLTPYMAINYYKQLAATYGGYAKLQEHIRLFFLPGTGHCSITSDGPGNFDAIGAIENWVEKKRAPDALVAALYSHKSPIIDPAKPPLRTMPLCKFPEMARYDGTGNVNDAAAWTCPPSDQRMLDVGESGRQAGVTP